MGWLDRFKRKPAEAQQAAVAPPGREGWFDQSEPPPGFRWHRFDEPHVSVLRPEGWHVHEARAHGSFTGCVSKESIPQHGSFQTGLTVQHIRRVLGRLGPPPSIFAVGLYQQTANGVSNTILLADQSQEQHGIATFVFRY